MFCFDVLGTMRVKTRKEELRDDDIGAGCGRFD